MSLKIRSKQLSTTKCTHKDCDSEPDHMWMGAVEEENGVTVVPALFCESHSHSHAVDVGAINYVGKIEDCIGVEPVEIGRVKA